MLALANTLQRGSQFLVLPLFLATMSGPNFVRYGLFTATFGLLAPLLTANIYLAHGRLFFDCRDDSDRADLFTTMLTAGLLSATAGFAALIVVLRSYNIEDALSLSDLRLQLGIACAMTASISTYFFVSVFRVLDRIAAYVGVASIVGIGLPLIYWCAFTTGMAPIPAVVLGTLASNGLAALAAAFLTRGSFHGGRFRPALLRPALSYSTGTAVYGIAVWALSLSGRWIGTASTANEEMAAYTLITQIYTLALVLTTVIFETFRVETLESFAVSRIDDAVARLNRTVAMAAASLALIYAATVVLILFQDHLLPSAYRLRMSWVVFASVYNFGMLIFIRAFWIAIGTKRTGGLAVVMCAVAAVTVTLAVTLVGPYGVEGLLAATMTGGILQAILGHMRSQAYIREAKQP